MALFVPELKLTTTKTEYGRNKVALAPGKGLMDWIRISTNKSLASQQLSSVSAQELMKHNQENDCWILIRGNVYDVTKYLEYHPGGIPELMRAAGTNGSKLFDQYHAWVNYSGMLKSCLVGPFKGDPSKLPRTKNPVFDNNPALKSENGMNGSNPSTLQDFALSISKPNPNVLRIKSIVGNLGAENIIVDATSKNLRLVIRRFDTETICVSWDGFDWSNRNFTLVLNPPKSLDVVFENKAALVDVRVLAQQVTTTEDQVFHPFVLQKMVKMTHNTMLYQLRGPTGLHFPVPMGQHLLFRLPFSDVQRPFTPITYQNCICTGLCDQDLQFFVKIYPDGKLTQNLAKIVEGDIIEISEPIGRKGYAKYVENADQVLLLAAGTGITPMMNIIQHRRKTFQNDQKTTLLFFNKTEDDICEELLSEFTDDDFGFQIEHVLSEASSKWTGESGQIRSELLAKLNLDWKNILIFVCGPKGFNNTVMDTLTKLNVPSEQIIVFQ